MFGAQGRLQGGAGGVLEGDPGPLPAVGAGHEGKVCHVLAGANWCLCKILGENMKYFSLQRDKKKGDTNIFSLQI